jgi:hypothetical protein
MAEVIVHQISYKKPRDIKIHTDRRADGVPTPASGDVFSHEELLSQHRELVRELGQLMIQDVHCEPNPSIPQLVRQHGIPSGSVIVEQVQP